MTSQASETSPPEPTEWQIRILRYLRLKYSHDLVDIPDRVRGDSGIEAFSRDGCCYQCYATEGETTQPERYENCRNKITRDIKKFCDNQESLGKFFLNTPIRRWVFVTPRHDNKELVAHAEKKAAEVRARKLPYATADFAIQIETEDSFERERSMLLSDGLRQLRIIPVGVDPEEVEAYAKANSSQIAKLDEKLGKLKLSAADTSSLKSKLLRFFLRGENALMQLRQYPQLYERIQNCRASRADFLGARSLFSKEAPNITLQRTIEEFTDELFLVAKGVDRNTAELLSYASTTDWLLKCDLKFPGD